MLRIAALVLCFACAPALAAPSTTMDAAQQLATQASDSDFVVPMNDVVLERLRKYRDTDKGRRFVQRALDLRATHRAMLQAAIASHGLPAEVEAIVLVESGYSNIEARPPRFPAAGIWQVITPTGQRYGLRVDDEVDERLQPERVTEAALLLLVDLYASFDDWGLAFAAYNRGEDFVRKAIAAEGTDDVWTLIARGALPPYAAQVMAGVIVLNEAP